MRARLPPTQIFWFAPENILFVRPARPCCLCPPLTHLRAVCSITVTDFESDLVAVVAEAGRRGLIVAVLISHRHVAALQEAVPQPHVEIITVVRARGRDVAQRHRIVSLRAVSYTHL